MDVLSFCTAVDLPVAVAVANSDLGRLISGSVSGRELIDRGFASDVEVAFEVDASRCAPMIVEGAYRGG